MSNNLRDLLESAQGKSEFVIVVVADIRGFSKFSNNHESPDTAMYIRRIYLELIDKYFPNANFYKPTGDGLLMTFHFSDEESLREVAKDVINSCIRALNDFRNLCDEDPMINYGDIPKNIGFGIARGTACCIYSGDEIIDYSGNLLNLSSRLMDLARPNGIVVAGNFLKETIPESYRSEFLEAEVYLRSIAEEKPIKIFYLRDYVEIPESAFLPLKEDKWHTMIQELEVRELAKLGPTVYYKLPERLKDPSKIKVNLIHPAMKSGNEVKGYHILQPFTDFNYTCEANEPIVTLKVSETYQYLKKIKVRQKRTIKFKINYVPIRPVKE